MSSPEMIIEPSTGLSEPARVLNTFVAPSKTFTDIRRNASWWMPWLLMSVLSVLFVVTLDHKIGFERVITNEIAKNAKAAERIEKLPAEQRDQIITSQSKFGKYMGYGSPITILVMMVIIAAILLGVFNFGFGADLKFPTAMAIVAYGWLPSGVRAILAIVTMHAGVDPEGFNIRVPVATTPAYFMDPTAHKFLYGVASSFDVIGIWIAVLVGLGFALNSKVKKDTAIWTVVGLYFVWNLGAAALGSMF